MTVSSRSSQLRRMTRIGVRFLREPAYRMRIVHLMQTQSGGAAVEPVRTADLRWFAGKRIYFVGGCEFTYVKEFVEASGAVTYHTFDHGRPSDPSVEVGDVETSLWDFNADAVCLSQVQIESAWLHTSQWQAFDIDRARQEDDLTALVSSLRRAVAIVRSRSDAPIILLSHPAIYRPFFGVLEQRILGERLSLAESIRRLDLALYDIAREVPDCYVLDVALLTGEIGWNRALEGGSELLGEHLTRDGARRVADGLLTLLHAVDSRSKKVKCVAVDLDDTLWSGILREDGPAGVTVRHQYLRALKILLRRGIVLAVCSKNDPGEAVHLEALLGKDLAGAVVCTELSWAPKSEGLRRIAQALNVGLDTIAFFDDNPRERAEVEMNAPEVRVFSDGDFLSALGLPEFQPGPTLTREAVNRSASYKAEAARRAAAQSVETTNPDDFLRSLELRLTLRPAGDAELPRVAELLARTNQLNATARRTDLATLRSLGGEGRVYTAELEDRFGDYGLIGAALVEWSVDAHVVELAFSCRAMGRRVEEAMLTYVRMEAARHGCADVVVPYRPTERNAELRRILERAGFTSPADVGEELLLRAPAEGTPCYPDVLRVDARASADPR